MNIYNVKIMASGDSNVNNLPASKLARDRDLNNNAMKKIIATVKKVNKLGLALIGAAAFTLMSFNLAESKQTTVKWTRNPANNQWVQVTGEYFCEDSSDICTHSYDAGVDPNTATNPIIRDTEEGTFLQ